MIQLQFKDVCFCFRRENIHHQYRIAIGLANSGHWTRLEAATCVEKLREACYGPGYGMDTFFVLVKVGRCCGVVSSTIREIMPVDAGSKELAMHKAFAVFEDEYCGYGCGWVVLPPEIVTKDAYYDFIGNVRFHAGEVAL